MSSSSIRRAAACAGLPAIVGLGFLLVISALVYGHAFRPGLWAEVLLVFYASLLLLQFRVRLNRLIEAEYDALLRTGAQAHRTAAAPAAGGVGGGAHCCHDADHMAIQLVNLKARRQPQ